MNDKTLLHILNLNPQRGMTLLVEQYTGLVWKVISLHLRNAENIKECTNDTFAEFYFHRDRFNPERSSLAVWLTAIARNLAISRFRKERKHLEESLPSVLPAALLSDQTDEIALAEIQTDLERAMDALRPDELQIIRMRYYDGMTVREIADSLELPYETVKKRHQRGIAKLRRTLFLTILILLALLTTACSTYVVLRHFDIIPPIFSWERQAPEEEPEDELPEGNTDDNSDNGASRLPEQRPEDSSDDTANEAAPATANTAEASDISDTQEINGINPTDFTFTEYGLNVTVGVPVYELKETCIGENEVLTLSLDQANYLNENLVLDLTMRLKNEPFQIAHENPVFQQNALLFFEGQTLKPITTKDSYLDEYTQTYQRTFLVNLPESETGELTLSFSMLGVQIDFTLIRAVEEPIQTYTMQVEEDGGLLAIPRLKDGSLIVAIYPINKRSDYTILPSLIYGLRGEPIEKPITITDSDGTELEGHCIGYYPNNPCSYYEWDFGAASPGEYTLHVPYVHMSAPLPEDFSIPINLEDMTWEETRSIIPGGSIWIESCEFLPDESEEEDTWKIQVRYQSDSDSFSVLYPYIDTSYNYIPGSHGTVNGHFDFDSENHILEIIMEIPPNLVDLTSFRLTTERTKTPVILRWNQAFDLTFCVE